MTNQERFDQAILRFDAANREDPRSELADGSMQPREWLFARRVYGWVERLVSKPSEALLLAARSHTLCRWKIPRNDYPRTTAGYHQWRDALARYHAEQAASILSEVGYDAATIEAVRVLITKGRRPGDPEAQALEDADCLVFLESKLEGYVDAWGEEKSVEILKSTIKKMSPHAQSAAMHLKLGEREAALLSRAVGDAEAESKAASP